MILSVKLHETTLSGAYVADTCQVTCMVILVYLRMSWGLGLH